MQTHIRRFAASDQGLTVCLSYRHLRLKETVLSPCSAPFSQPTLRDNLPTIAVSAVSALIILAKIYQVYPFSLILHLHIHWYSNTRLNIWSRHEGIKLVSCFLLAQLIGEHEHFSAIRFENDNYCWDSHIYQQREFDAQLSWAWIKFYNPGDWLFLNYVLHHLLAYW